MACDLIPCRFAALLGVAENTVRRWEIGDRHPRVQHYRKLKQLAKRHGVKLDCF